MAMPGGSDVKTFLEGYGVTDDVITDPWIEARRDNYIIPMLKNALGFDFTGSGDTITEYLSGNGKMILPLGRRNATSIVNMGYVTSGDIDFNLTLAAILDTRQGILIAKSLSPEGVLGPTLFIKGEKNIKIVYTVNGLCAELEELVLYQMAKSALIFIATRTGGGNLGAQAYSRDYGPRGKYSHIINQLDTDSLTIISHYRSGCVGP